MDRYLQYDSHHPVHVKRGVEKYLFDRARSISQGQECQKEEQHLKDVLENNGYPECHSTNKENRRTGISRNHHLDSLCC